jgi:Sulfotransferase domain
MLNQDKFSFSRWPLTQICPFRTIINLFCVNESFGEKFHMSWIVNLKRQVKYALYSILGDTISKDMQRARNRVISQARLIDSNEVDENDIFIVGYPKSGNTWFQNLVVGIQYGIDLSKAPHTLVNDLAPDVEDDYYRRHLSPTIFKSHRRPLPHHRRVVYLVRDGRDVMVSLYHFHQGTSGENTPSNFVAMVKDTGLKYGHWHTHIEEWLANPYKAEMIIIRYEDLLTDPVSALMEFCKFAKFERTQQELEQVVEGASFDNMRQREKQYGIHIRKWKNETFFIRRGQSGSYRDEMPPEVLDIFMEMAGDTLSRLDYL